jgi:hypothetical protein
MELAAGERSALKQPRITHAARGRGWLEAAGSSRASDGAGPTSRFREAAPPLLADATGWTPIPRFILSAGGPNVRGGRCTPRRRPREAPRTTTAHRCRTLSVSLCATFRVDRLHRTPNPGSVALRKPMMRPGAAGARGASLFSTYVLEAPGSGRTSRTLVRAAASLDPSTRAARELAHPCRPLTLHPRSVTRSSTDGARPRPPCATRRDAFSSYARLSPESIRFVGSRWFLAYRTVFSCCGDASG